MSLDFDAVATQLAAVINDAQLTLNDLQITGLDFLPDAPSPPVFCVCEFQNDFHQSFGGLMKVNVTCRLFVPRGGDDEGQRTARRAASDEGENSIKAALEAERRVNGGTSLDGTVDDFIVRSAQGPRLYQFGEVNHYGVEFTVFVTG